MTDSKDIVDIVTDIFRENLPKSMVKEFFYGDILNPNLHNVPVMAIMPVSVDRPLNMNCTDMETTTLLIRYIVSKPANIRNPKAGAGGVKLLREYMEGKNPDGTDKENTIMGVLRRKFSLPDEDGNPRILTQEGATITYNSLVDQDVTQRTYEASIEVTMQRNIAVDNRE